MKILIDMNLSPEWVYEFSVHHIEAIHWSHVGEIQSVILARECVASITEFCN